MAKSFPLQVPITALDRFTGPLGKMAGATGAFGAKLKRVGKDLTTYVTLPVLGLATAAAAAGTDVRRNLNRVALATGAPADAMANLRAEAEALGGETHTFRQVAEAMALLSEENERLEDIQAGTVPTLHLATIAHLELGESVASLDGILDAYGKTTQDAAHSVDVLAAAGQGAKLQGLLDALRTAGPLLASTGTGLEGSVALLRELGDAGFDASRAGSAVQTLTQKLSRAFKASTTRGFFSRLRVRPEEIRQSTGELRPLVDIVDLLRERGAKASDVVRAFGAEAGPALAALIDRGTASVRKNTEAYRTLNGESRRQVAILQSGGVDSTVKLANAWDRVATALAESGILDALADVVRWVGRGVEWFRALDGSTQRWIVTAGGVAAALGPVLVTLGSLVQLVGAASKGLAVLSSLGGGAAAAGAGGAAAGGAAGGGLLATLGPLAVIAASVYSLAKDIPQGIETVVGMRREAAQAEADRAFFAARGRPAMDAGAFGRTAGPLPAPSGARGGVDVGGTVTIELPNLPDGSRVTTKKRGPVNLDVYAGPSLASPL